MRIIHIVESLDYGGLERMVVDMVRQQRNLGFTCKVISLFHAGIMAKNLEALDVEVTALNKINAQSKFKLLKQLREQIKVHDTDIIHTHNPTSHYYATVASIGLNYKVLINTRHGLGSRFALTTKIKHIKREIFYRLTFPFSHYLVAVSYASYNELIKRNIFRKKRSSVIYNGIFTADFQKVSENARKDLLEHFNLKHGDFIFGIVSRISTVKNHNFLIKVFHQLKQVKENVKLIIVGDGDPDLVDSLRQSINQHGLTDCVHMLGARSDINIILSTFDCFILPSKVEGCSIALLEAAATGLPIIASEVGGNMDIIENRENGLLFPVNDSTACLEAMMNIMCDPEYAAKLGRNARTWVEENATVERMVENYNQLYQSNF